MTHINRSGVLFALVGPAGSGKSTIAGRLLKALEPSVSLSISVTSRAPRAGEVEGVHYHFVTREVFQKKIAAGEFFEWEETHGNYYGTLSTTIETAVHTSVDLILDIDIRGALNFKRRYPHNTAIVFILPPSSAVLIERLKKRGSITETEIEKRLATAREEYVSFRANRSLIDYTLVNDSLEETFAAVQSVLTAERSRLSRLKDEDLNTLLKI